VQCTVFLMMAKLGGGATETGRPERGGGVGARCAVYMAELLRDSLVYETTMQWRNKALFYSPSSVLNQWKRSLSFAIGNLAKEDDFSDTRVLKVKTGAVFIYSVHPKGNACPRDFTSDHRFSVILDFRQVRFSVIPDFRQVGISVTVSASRKLVTRIFRNHPVPSRPVPEIR